MRPLVHQQEKVVGKRMRNYGSSTLLSGPMVRSRSSRRSSSCFAATRGEADKPDRPGDRSPFSSASVRTCGTILSHFSDGMAMITWLSGTSMLQAQGLSSSSSSGSDFGVEANQTGAGGYTSASKRLSDRRPQQTLLWAASSSEIGVRHFHSPRWSGVAIFGISGRERQAGQ